VLGAIGGVRAERAGARRPLQCPFTLEAAMRGLRIAVPVVLFMACVATVGYAQSAGMTPDQMKAMSGQMKMMSDHMKSGKMTPEQMKMMGEHMQMMADRMKDGQMSPDQMKMMNEHMKTMSEHMKTMGGQMKGKQ